MLRYFILHFEYILSSNACEFVDVDLIKKNITSKKGAVNNPTDVEPLKEHPIIIY